MIVSVDGIKDIFNEMVKGKANCTIECNPLLEPQVMRAAKDILAGRTMPDWIKSNESSYTQYEAKAALAS